MKMYGKILFYNEQNGNGIVITKNNQKLNFNITEWESYDQIPEAGLIVSFNRSEDDVTSIKVMDVKEAKKKSTASYQSTPKAIEPLKSAPKCKNKDLTKIGDELNALLNDSSNNINSLNAKISISMDIAQTMHSYFDHLKKALQKREGYKKVNGRLEYSFAKRFLWTTFNNLVDIDSDIVTLRISSISDDLKFVSKLKDDFEKKVQYPLTAFEDIFLSSQVEYTLVKQMTEEIIQRLNLLKSKEEKLNFEKEKKKREIQNTSDKEQKAKHIKELKVLNGTYVDIVHMMAKLQDIHKINTKRLHDFESTYKESFYKKFQSEAKKHQIEINDILNAQAYLLDFLLWKEAKTSPAILDYFHSLSIDIELNSKTYLKYYLSSIDESKANKETKDLFAYYEYLEEHQKDYILILTASTEDAIEYCNTIQRSNKKLCVKAFVSELESIKWATLNTIKIIVLEDTLLTTSAQNYLDYYHTHIFSKPKIILLGNAQNIKSNNYTIDKNLPKMVSSKLLKDSIHELL